MTRRAELKQKARGSLKGNYGVVVGVMLLSSVVLGVCSGILQLVCGVVGTFSTAGSIALGGAAGLGSQVSIAVATGSVPSIVCSLLTSIIYSGLTYILMVGGIRVYLKLCAGEKAGIEDLFWGFQNDPIRFGGIGALISVVMELCLLPVVILAVAMGVSKESGFLLFAVLFGIDLWDVPLCLSGPSGNDVMAGPWRKQETDEGKPDPSGDAADQFYRLGTYFHIDSGNWSFVVKWLYSLYDRMVL